MQKIEMISLADILPCKENRHPTKESVHDLALSIAAQGLLNPIVVRPLVIEKGVPAKNRYEIICGERRFVALQTMKSADVKAAPCIVLEVDEKKAAEIRAVENLQREDLSPLQSAAEIERLKDYGLGYDEIASALGKHYSWVAKRARLCSLTKKWKEALKDKESLWPVGSLELIARHPFDVQDEILESESPMSLSETKECLDRYMLSMKSAKWDLADITFGPKTAGACDTCEKRSGHHPSLFDDLDKKDDRCLDRECFAKKQRAYLIAKEKELLEKAPDTILLGHSYEFEENNPFGSKVINEYDVEKVKKDTKGAKPALIVSGPDAGKTVYVKTHKEVEKTAGAKTLKEKREGLEKRRDIWVINQVLDFLQDEKKVAEVFDKIELPHVAQLVMAFGAWSENDLTGASSAGSLIESKATADTMFKKYMATPLNLFACCSKTIQRNLKISLQGDIASGVKIVVGMFSHFGKRAWLNENIADKRKEAVPEPKSWTAEK